MKRILIVCLSVILLSFSCERKGADKSTAEKETKTEIVKRDIDLLTDSVNTAWNEMMAMEDQKFLHIKRLLDEISYTSSYDMVAHDSLVKKIDKVKAQRFDQNLDTSAIDNYYAATDKFIMEVFQLKGKTKGIEQHPLADELMEDINKANSAETVAQKLQRYNFWANQYNSYIKKHKNQLEKLGAPYTSYKEKPVLFKI